MELRRRAKAVLGLLDVSTMMPARERIGGWTIIPWITIDVAVPGIETVEPAYAQRSRQFEKCNVVLTCLTPGR
jgi:hypothetical protein